MITRGATDLGRGLIARRDLLARLEAASEVPVIVLAAPAGYGKTTLLGQWRDADPRPFAWADLDERDNDPEVLVERVIGALEALEPLSPSVAVALAQGSPLSTVVLPALARALSTGRRPFVLVLDDAWAVRTVAAREVLRALVAAMPPGSQIALASRSEPEIGAGFLRAQGRVAELGADDLAFTLEEGIAVLELLGVDLPAEQAARLVEKVEGWPAGLRLAVLAWRGGAAGVGVEDVSGDDRPLREYLWDRVLGLLDPDTVEFLLGSSVLDRMTGPLCDAVLDRDDSQAMLAELERSDLFLVPLDHHGEQYRYHHLFSETLRGELRRRDRRRAGMLHRRASRWLGEHGDEEGAVRHALRGGSPKRAAKLVWGVAASGERTLPARDEVETWLRTAGDLSAEGVAARSLLALAMAWRTVEDGHGDEVRQWSAVAQRGSYPGRLPGGPASLESAARLLRAVLGRHGAARMVADAVRAYELDDDHSRWRGACRLFEGVGWQLQGDGTRAASCLSDAEERCFETLPSLHALALSQLALLAEAEGRWARASELIDQALDEARRHGIGGHVILAPAHGMRSLILGLHQSDQQQAALEMRRARLLVSHYRDFCPWLGVQCRLVLARTNLAIANPSGARNLVAEAGALLPEVPDAPALGDMLADVASAAEAFPLAAAGEAALTTAELRVLRHLPTHLSFAEIGARLHTSRNTVKSQALSIYRKLHVSSRAEAVKRARELSLLEG